MQSHKELLLAILTGILLGFIIVTITRCGQLSPQFIDISKEAQTAAYSAFDKLETCGIEPKQNFSIHGSMSDELTIFINCGQAHRNGTKIWLFESVAKKHCGLEITLGHEMLHLKGYDHDSQTSAQQFYGILENCGFKQGT